jgi:hypothetical protein
MYLSGMLQPANARGYLGVGDFEFPEGLFTRASTSCRNYRDSSHNKTHGQLRSIMHHVSFPKVSSAITLIHTATPSVFWLQE